MMKNRKPGNCCWCGEYLAPGEGDLFHVHEESENLGFGPMGWTGWLVKCPDLATCQARRKRLNELVKLRNIWNRNIAATEQRIFQNGEYVQPNTSDRINLNGTVYERKGKGHDIYGGGTQYCVTKNHVWKIENNGMDGDDWSQNNIRTGGAGAIGTRFEKTEIRIAFLEAHAENKTEKWEKEKAAEEKAERERNEKIKAGLEAMLARTSGGWNTLEKAMKKAGMKTFCPKELIIQGTKRGMVNLTIEQAKQYLS